MNLAANSRDAMPAGGTFTLATPTSRSAGRPLPDAEMAPGEYVRLTVSDSGDRDDAGGARALFEPFFTTKAPGRAPGSASPRCTGS